MATRFPNPTATLALSMALLVTPALLDTTGLWFIGSAHAEKGGKGNSNSGGNGNGNGNTGGNGSAKSENSSSANNSATGNASNGKTAKELAAFNAAHASAKAFANAAPNSRIGKIKTYYLSNQIAIAAKDTAAATDATALRATLEGLAPPEVISAYENLQVDPSLQAVYDAAVTAAIIAGTLTADPVTALAAAYTDWQNAVAADDLAAQTAATAEADLNAAANKTPVSPETKDALDALLAGKIY